MKIKHSIPFLFFVALAASCDREATHEATDQVIYTCPMDPQVRESEPGPCPICRMPLTPVTKSEIMEEGEIRLSDQQILLGHVTWDTVTDRNMGRELQFTGRLAVDQNRVLLVQSRMMGRIEKLYPKSIGDLVRKGDPLFDIYSEDLNLAIRELKLALLKKERQQINASDVDRLVESARTRLLLFGLSEARIAQLASSEIIPESITIYSPSDGVITAIHAIEGSYVSEGGSIVELTDYSTLWAEAEVFSTDIAKIRTGMPATIHIPGDPNEPREAKVSFINPAVNNQSLISLIRVEIDNRNRELRPGTLVSLSVRTDNFHSLAVPVNAILHEEKGSVAWIKTGENTFKSIMVETGLESGGYVVIKKGLKKNDVLVVTGVYLLNSEYIFQRGANPMQGHDMSNM